MLLIKWLFRSFSEKFSQMNSSLARKCTHLNLSLLKTNQLASQKTQNEIPNPDNDLEVDPFSALHSLFWLNSQFPLPSLCGSSHVHWSPCLFLEHIRGTPFPVMLFKLLGNLFSGYPRWLLPFPRALLPQDFIGEANPLAIMAASLWRCPSIEPPLPLFMPCLFHPFYLRGPTTCFWPVECGRSNAS